MVLVQNIYHSRDKWRFMGIFLYLLILLNLLLSAILLNSSKFDSVLLQLEQKLSLWVYSLQEHVSIILVHYVK